MKDAQLKKFVLEFREGILGGRSSHMMCFAICSPLAPLLEMSGVKCELVEGVVVWTYSGKAFETNHFWFSLPDGRIIDPTADQFDPDGDKVYLGPKPANYTTP